MHIVGSILEQQKTVLAIQEICHTRYHFNTFVGILWNQCFFEIQYIDIFFFDLDISILCIAIYPQKLCLCHRKKSWTIDRGFSPYNKDPASLLYFLLQWKKIEDKWGMRRLRNAFKEHVTLNPIHTFKQTNNKTATYSKTVRYLTSEKKTTEKDP